MMTTQRGKQKNTLILMSKESPYIRSPSLRTTSTQFFQGSRGPFLHCTYQLEENIGQKAKKEASIVENWVHPRKLGKPNSSSGFNFPMHCSQFPIPLNRLQNCICFRTKGATVNQYHWWHIHAGSSPHLKTFCVSPLCGIPHTLSHQFPCFACTAVDMWPWSPS